MVAGGREKKNNVTLPPTRRQVREYRMKSAAGSLLFQFQLPGQRSSSIQSTISLLLPPSSSLLPPTTNNQLNRGASHPLFEDLQLLPRHPL